jgi:TPR repeat protein
MMTTQLLGYVSDVIARATSRSWKARSFSPGALGRAALLVAAVAAVGCNRDRSDKDQPAPSASVVTLGIELGACPDVPACARECDAGSADRCRRLAMSYELGKGVERDEARATILFLQACDMKDPSACVFAGQAFEFEHGVTKDDARAAMMYERACDLQWAPGCYNLAIMYERGTGVPADRAKAADLYQVACTAGAKQACAKSGELRKPPAFPFLDGAVP